MAEQPKNNVVRPHYMARPVCALKSLTKRQSLVATSGTVQW